MESGTLYLCATPIGNLSDISARTLKTLEAVDFIVAEDTRHTLGLLNHFKIKKPLVSYFEHNKKQRGEMIIKRLLEGQSAALVSDAGTPAISDPGEDLVALCIENEIEVIPIPGACAFIQALIVSGLPTERFVFEGFLAVGKAARKEHLAALSQERRTLVFYEAPHKLMTTLNDLYKAFGERRISISREITKKFEQTLRLTLSAAISHFEQNPPKGEFVLVVEGTTTQTPSSILPDRITPFVQAFINEGLSSKEALKKAAQTLKIPKNLAYSMLLSEKEE